MAGTRIASAVLSVLLAAILAWSLIAGAGDLRTQVFLGTGVVLGLLYTCVGRVPAWIVNYSGGSIASDDDPSNISPRVYLPILVGVILVALVAFAVVVFVL